jgi:hypothetical protein
MPGMWDCHVHFMGLQTVVSTAILESQHKMALTGVRCARDAMLMLEAGFTSVREMALHVLKQGLAIIQMSSKDTPRLIERRESREKKNAGEVRNRTNITGRESIDLRSRWSTTVGSPGCSTTGFPVVWPHDTTQYLTIKTTSLVVTTAPEHLPV